jgi:hypothetical protein
VTASLIARLEALKDMGRTLRRLQRRSCASGLALQANAGDPLLFGRAAVHKVLGVKFQEGRVAMRGLALLLVALPVVADAECGWLLMAPMDTRARVPGEWRQVSAFDTAAACERWRNSALEEAVRKTRDAMTRSNETQVKARLDSGVTWIEARCLPSDQAFQLK